MHLKFYLDTMSIKMLQKKSINTRVISHTRRVGWYSFLYFTVSLKNLMTPHASAKESSKTATRVLAQSETNTQTHRGENSVVFKSLTASSIHFYIYFL